MESPMEPPQLSEELPQAGRGASLGASLGASPGSGSGSGSGSDISGIALLITQKRTKRVVYSEEFEQFWNSYPHRGVPDGKAETNAAWLKLTVQDRCDIPRAVANYAKSKKVIDGFAK